MVLLSQWIANVLWVFVSTWHVIKSQGMTLGTGYGTVWYSCMFSVARSSCNLERKSTGQKDFKARPYIKLKERMRQGTSYQAMMPRNRSLLSL